MKYLHLDGRGTAGLLEVGLGPISQPIGPQPFRGRVLGRSLGRALSSCGEARTSGIPREDSEVLRGVRGWDFWLYPAGQERLDMLTSGEEVLRSVGFGFSPRL